MTTWRRSVATLLPAAIPPAMGAVFGWSTRRFGPERGYQAGFTVYWASCWALATAVLGPRELARLWRTPRQPLPSPRTLAVAALVVPPLGALASQWLPRARTADATTVAVAAAVGTTNALAEEVLWRGIPVAVFPDEPMRGWWWPAVGFTAWHLVPLAAHPTGLRRRAALLAGAASIGLGHGWIAFRTRSLVAVATAHAITDSSGLRPIEEIWMPHLPWRGDRR